MKAKRELYGPDAALPNLYIAAKLFVHCSKLYNKAIQKELLSIDDIETLTFYANVLQDRASVCLESIDKTASVRNSEYNSDYSCAPYLSVSDILSFLVVKALRIKNIYNETQVFDKDSVVDFLVYLRMLMQKGLLSELHLVNEPVQNREYEPDNV